MTELSVPKGRERERTRDIERGREEEREREAGVTARLRSDLFAEASRSNHLAAVGSR